MGLALIALCGVVGWEVYTNGEMAKQSQAAAIGAAKSAELDVHTVSQSVAATTNSINGTVGKLGTAVDGMTNTLEAINRPCGVMGKPCGVLADVNQSLHTVRGTFGYIEIAAQHEDRNLDKLDKQEDQLFADTHASLTQFTSMMGSGKDTLDSGRQAIDNINGFLADKTLRETAENVQSMTKSGASIMDTGDKLFTKLTDKTLHPSKNPAVRTWRATQPYLPLAIKATTCYLVPGTC
jgi:hypothetical protein